MKQIPIYIVDAFTRELFSGNPAAVCLLSENLDAEICQKIAFEMNLSETAFITLANEKDTFEKSKKFGLRWFTPTNEVPLCGHATLASATVLFNICGNVNSEIHFETMRGELICRKSESGLFTLDFPQYLVTKAPEDPVISMLVQETVKDLTVHSTCYSPDSKKLIIVLDEYNNSRVEIEKLVVNTSKLLELHPSGDICRGVAITMKGSLSNGCVDSEQVVYDFVSRYFSPWNGIPEDPVTGSLHCVLGLYWSKTLGKSELYCMHSVR